MTNRNRTDRLNNSRRRCSLEPLEARMLLTASGWGGFNPNPDVSTYSVEASEIEIDFGKISDVDLAGITDLNGDGLNDLITVENVDSAPRLTLHYGSGEGCFVADSAIELGQVGGYTAAGILADLTGDGILDYLSVSQGISDSSVLNLNLYQYQKDGGFAKTGSSSVSLSVFGNYSVYTVTSIRLAEIGGNLAVQLENSFGFDVSGKSYSLDGTAVCVNDGKGIFSNPVLAPSFTGALVGSVNVGGTDFLVSLNKESRTFGFWSYNSAKVSWSNAGSISYTSSVGNIGIVSTAMSGNRLWFSGNVSGSTLIADFSLVLSSSKVTLASVEVYTLQRARTMPTVLVSGDLNNDHYGDLLLIDTYRYTAMLGTSAGGFLEVGTTIAQTDYLASVSVDFDGDGEEELLTVGAIGAWIIDMNHPDADPVQYANFSDEASAALFGDFDGDGFLEIAVLEKETNRAGIYDYIDGQYQRVQLISAPVDVEKGITITADGAALTVGHFTANDYDQILIQYSWANGAGDSALVYDVLQQEALLQIDLEDGESFSVLAAGHLYAIAGPDDIAAVVEKDQNYFAATWKYNSGKYSRQVNVKLGSVSDYCITDLAIGDLNGDKFGDLLFLNAGFGTEGGLGWLTKNGTSSFTVAGKGWGETTLVDGVFSGLLLEDVTGDGIQDAVTTLVSDSSGQQNCTFIYMAEGTGVARKPFSALELQPLAGEYASGIDFDGGQLFAPALSFSTDSETGLGNVNLVKGRTAVLVRSLEGGTGNEGFCYLVHSAASERPEITITDPSLLESDYYDWVDEWSSFYVEIWGTANGNFLSQFKTSVTFDSTCFAVNSIESGAGFSSSMAVENQTVSISGYSTASIAPKEGDYILLARILFRPTKTGGVTIPDNGAFNAYSAGFGIKKGSESINGAYSCALSDREALESLTLFSVRLDYNDDGAVDIKDFTAFASDYGHGTADLPYKNPKSATFDVTTSGSGLNIQDFTVFAKAFGVTSAKISERFYDMLGIDPNSWIPASAELLEETADQVFEEAVWKEKSSDFDMVFFVLQDDDDEKDWFLSF